MLDETNFHLVTQLYKTPGSEYEPVYFDFILEPALKYIARYFNVDMKLINFEFSNNRYDFSERHTVSSSADSTIMDNCAPTTQSRKIARKITVTNTFKLLADNTMTHHIKFIEKYLKKLLNEETDSYTFTVSSFWNFRFLKKLF